MVGLASAAGAGPVAGAAVKRAAGTARTKGTTSVATQQAAIRFIAMDLQQAEMASGQGGHGSTRTEVEPTQERNNRPGLKQRELTWRAVGGFTADPARLASTVIPNELCSEGSRDGNTRCSGPRSLAAKLRRDDPLLGAVPVNELHRARCAGGGEEVRCASGRLLRGDSRGARPAAGVASRGDRQADRKGRPLAHLGLDLDPPVVVLDDLLADRQPQARALGLALAGGPLGGEERLEDLAEAAFRGCPGRCRSPGSALSPCRPRPRGRP